MDSELRRRMLDRMDEVGIKMKELAELTGDPYRSVQNWLAGTTIPAAFLVRYAAVVPVNIDWLVTGRGEPNPVPEDTRARLFGIIASVVQVEDADEADRMWEWWEAFKQTSAEE